LIFFSCRNLAGQVEYFRYQSWAALGKELLHPVEGVLHMLQSLIVEQRRERLRKRFLIDLPMSRCMVQFPFGEWGIDWFLLYESQPKDQRRLHAVSYLSES